MPRNDELFRTSVEQPNRGGYVYPFVGEDVVAAELITDLQVQYTATHVLPLRLTGTVSQETSSLSLVIEDAVDQVVMNIEAATLVSKRAWSADYFIFRHEQDGLLATIVMHAEDIGDVVVEGQILDKRACVPVLPAVTSLSVYEKAGDDSPIGTFDYQSQIHIKPGYNMRLDAVPTPAKQNTGNRRRSQTVFNAIPGEGLGKISDCDEEILLRTINRMEGEADNFSISSDLCLRVERPVTVTDGGNEFAEATISVNNDCDPCCDCGNYYSFYRALERTGRLHTRNWGVLGEAGELYKELLPTFEDNLQESFKELRLELATGSDCITMCRFSYVNNLDEAITNVTLQAVISKVDGEVMSPVNSSEIPPTGIPANCHVYNGVHKIGTSTIFRIGSDTLRIVLDEIPARSIVSVIFGMHTIVPTGQVLRYCLSHTGQDPGIHPACKDVTVTCSAASPSALVF